MASRELRPLIWTSHQLLPYVNVWMTQFGLKTCSCGCACDAADSSPHMLLTLPLNQSVYSRSSGRDALAQPEKPFHKACGQQPGSGQERRESASVHVHTMRGEG